MKLFYPSVDFAALHNRTDRHRGLRRPAVLSVGAATPARRFAPPWTAEELDACFVVHDLSGQALAISISRTSRGGYQRRTNEP